MWSYAVIRRSAARSFVRATPQLAVLDLRSFSSSGGGGNDDKNNNNNNSNNRGAGAGNDQGQRGNQRRNNNNNNNNDNTKGAHGRRPKKPNFSETFLEPAAKGQLKKGHQSGIPKLAGRRPKGHGVRGDDPEGLMDNQEFLGAVEPDEMTTMSGRYSSSNNSDQRGGSPPPPPPKTGTMDTDSPLDKLAPEEMEQVKMFMEGYRALEGIPDEELYYWNEVDHEAFVKPKEQALMDKVKADAVADADGNLVAEVDDHVYEYLINNYEQFRPPRPEQQQQRGGRRPPRDDKPADLTPFVSIMDYATGDRTPVTPGPEYEGVTPLAPHGPGISDLVTTMMEHGTQYAELRYDNPHPTSQREPIPDLPKNRVNPSKEFVEEYTRFLYVWGLPPVMVDGKPADFENPIHRHEIQKTISNLFDVDSEHVSPASLTSGFIGLHFREDQLFALQVGPDKEVLERPVVISKYQPSEQDSAFCQEAAPNSIVMLNNLPEGSTATALARNLFPPGTDVAEVYGLTTDNIRIVSPTSALVRFESADMAESAISSSMVQQRLEEVGQHRVRFAKARRELVFTGKHGGPDRTDRLRELGPRLIVDGDMPTKQFYLSHADTIHLRNLDPSVTKQQIADFFQPYCSAKRDVTGSVEFVTCRDGLKTTKAYVGFDELGEMEAVMAAFRGGRMQGLGDNGVIFKSVKDINRIPREKRSARSSEELLDSLDNWEQYADPEDVQYLIENGIAKEALDEALRAIRYHNPTFASLDQAMRAETLQPEFESGGLYAELVRRYITTLKECVATPENPGEIYLNLFLPDEEIDTEIFDREPKRQEELRKRRQIPSSQN
jgi:hypothetical protein